MPDLAGAAIAPGAAGLIAALVLCGISWPTAPDTQNLTPAAKVVMVLSVR